MVVLWLAASTSQTLAGENPLRQTRTQYCIKWRRQTLNSYLSLSQLVVVMGESEIEPSTVDVHGLTQDRSGHGWTFNVPARPSLLEHLTNHVENFLKLNFYINIPLSIILWWSSGLTFPQGESHEGSPGLEAFHSAKSLGDFFSLNLSAEMLRSPMSTDTTHRRVKTMNT